MKKWYIYFLGAAHFCCDINTGSLPALLPFFIAAYHFDYKLAAGLMFASSFLSSFIQPVFGYLADKVSKSCFMAFGVLMSCMAFGAIAFLHDYWAIFTTVTFMGIGNAIFHPEAARLVNQISGERKSFFMSVFSTGGNCGFCLGPVIAVAIVANWGLKGMFVYGIIGLLMGLPLLFLAPQIKAAAAEMAVKKEEESAVPIQAENDWNGFGKLTGVIFFCSICYTALRSFLPLYCIDVLGQTKEASSFTLTILSFMGVVTTLIGGILADKIGNIKFLRYCLALMVTIVAAVLCFKNIYIIYVLMLPLGFSVFALTSPFVVLGQEYLAKNIGFASGITLGIAFTVGGMMAPVLGYLGDQFGLLMVMRLIIGLSFAGFLMSYLLPKPKSGR